MGIWDSREFVLHVRSAIHAYKQMEHDVKFSRAEEAVTTAMLNLEIMKDEYTQVLNLERKMQKGTN